MCAMLDKGKFRLKYLKPHIKVAVINQGAELVARTISLGLQV